jgi:ABC-type multidrug transport system fused ATPase/permease subunit
LLSLAAYGLIQGGCLLIAAIALHKSVDLAFSDGLENFHLTATFTWLIGAGIVASLMRLAERYTAEKVGQSYVQELRLTLYDAFSRMSRNQRSGQGLGVVTVRMVGDLSAIRQWISLGLARLLSSGIIIAITLIYLATFDVGITFSVAICLLVGFSATIIAGKSLKAATSEARKERGKMSNIVAEHVSSMSSMLAFG